MGIYFKKSVIYSLRFLAFVLFLEILFEYPTHGSLIDTESVSSTPPSSARTKNLDEAYAREKQLNDELEQHSHISTSMSERRKMIESRFIELQKIYHENEREQVYLLEKLANLEGGNNVWRREKEQLFDALEFITKSNPESDGVALSSSFTLDKMLKSISAFRSVYLNQSKQLEAASNQLKTTSTRVAAEKNALETAIAAHKKDLSDLKEIHSKELNQLRQTLLNEYEGNLSNAREKNKEIIRALKQKHATKESQYSSQREELIENKRKQALNLESKSYIISSRKLEDTLKGAFVCYVAIFESVLRAVPDYFWLQFKLFKVSSRLFLQQHILASLPISLKTFSFIPQVCQRMINTTYNHFLNGLHKLYLFLQVLFNRALSYTQEHLIVFNSRVDMFLVQYFLITPELNTLIPPGIGDRCLLVGFLVLLLVLAYRIIAKPIRLLLHICGRIFKRYCRSNLCRRRPSTFPLSRESNTDRKSVLPNVSESSHITKDPFKRRKNASKETKENSPQLKHPTLNSSDLNMTQAIGKDVIRNGNSSGTTTGGTSSDSNIYSDDVAVRPASKSFFPSSEGRGYRGQELRNEFVGCKKGVFPERSKREYK